MEAVKLWAQHHGTVAGDIAALTSAQQQEQNHVQQEEHHEDNLHQQDDQHEDNLHQQMISMKTIYINSIDEGLMKGLHSIF
jgi:hypothetical protein